jgi:ribonuclease P protein component
MYYQEYPIDGVTMKWAFSVSKKNYDKAIHRNTIKRMMKEAVRLSKPELLLKLPENKTYICLIAYNASKILPQYSDISLQMDDIFTKFLSKVNQ